MYHTPSHRSTHRHSSQSSYSQGGAPPPPGQYGRPQQSQGGYGYQQPPPGPPNGANPELYQWFSTVDADRSGQITVTELQSALVNGAYFLSKPCANVELIISLTGNWTSEL